MKDVTKEEDPLRQARPAEEAASQAGKRAIGSPLVPNKTCSMDFVSVKIESGRTFRVLQY